MTKNPNFLFVSLLFFCVFGHSLNAFRTWTDDQGRTMEARLVRIIDDDTIRIERSDGWVGNVALALLSEQDRKYVRIEQTIERLERAEPLQSETFQIRSLRRGTTPGYISTDAGWEHRIQSIIAVVRYSGDLPHSPGYVRAYFYDRDNQEVGSFDAPPRRQDANQQYQNAPKSFTAGVDYEVHFPLTQALQDRSWRTVIVVFGHNNTSSLRSIPSQIRPIEFNFREKENFYPELSAAIAARLTNATETVRPDATFTLQLQRPRRVRHPLTISSGGEWKRNLDCIVVDVRAVGGIPQESLSIDIRFYDENKRRVAIRQRPSMTNVEGQVYSRIPELSRAGNWYPVFFALDGDLANQQWTYALIRAQSGSQTSEIVMGPGNPSPDTFSR
jgi:hypothetical protein